MKTPRTLLALAAVACLAQALPAQTSLEPPQAPAPAPPPGGQMRRPAPAPAPRPGPMGPDLGKWWKNSDVARELALTDAQTAQIEQTFFDHRMKLIDLNADVQRNEARLQPLIEADTVDEAKIGAQLDSLLAARSRLEKANVMMMLSIRKVLSVEQWKRLERVKEQHMHRMQGPPGVMGNLMGPRRMRSPEAVPAAPPEAKRPPDAPVEQQ